MDQKKVIIIGAGLAGLTAAYKIQKENKDLEVTVLEATSYPGGRVQTTEFGGEAGAEFINNCKELMELTSELEVPLGSVPLLSFERCYYFKKMKEWVLQQDWPRWKHNPLPSELKKISPLMLLKYFCEKIKKPAEKELFTASIDKEYAAESLYDFLMKENCPQEIFPIIQMNFEVFNISLKKVSAFIPILKTWVRDKTKGSLFYFIKGGNGNLPKELAKLSNIKYQQEVIAVTKAEKNTYRIETKQGQTYHADYVIFSIPTLPMKKIKIFPPLEGFQAQAFQKIQYIPSIKLFYKCNSPFWEKDGLPLLMWTDTEVNLIAPIFDPKTRHSPVSGPHIWGFYMISSGEAVEKLYEIEKKGISIGEYCLSILEKIRPSAKGCLEFIRLFDWGRTPTAQGAFFYYPPDPDIPQYIEAIAKPSDNRFFAGDHTEYRYKGLEAAVASGKRVAKEVCETYQKQVHSVLFS